MPTADDLFRPTAQPRNQGIKAVPDEAQRESESASESAKQQPPRPSGRVRHDEKMTVYVTADELLHIEDARLNLRREHGLAVDRGRLVREAIALALADLEKFGSDSAVVRRLLDQ